MSTSARGCPPNQASQVGRPRKRASTPQVSFEALQGGSGVGTCLPTANWVTRPWPPTGVRADMSVNERPQSAAAQKARNQLRTRGSGNSPEGARASDTEQLREV